MTVTPSTQNRSEWLAAEFRMPPPSIPKQTISAFTWLMMCFAVLVLVGLAVSFARMATAPHPVLDVPVHTPSGVPGS